MNSRIKQLMRVTCAATLAAVLVTPTTSHAASGSTAVDVTFPPLIILYYFNTIGVTVDADDLETLISNGNAALAGCTAGASLANAELECTTAANATITGAGTISGSQINYDADIAADANVSATVDGTITVVLENSWAVRALASGLTASVALSGAGEFVAGSESILPTAPTASLTLVDGDNIGDVQFDVDIDNIGGDVTASDTLTITVVSP
jgi:hypothetical protein